MTGYLRGEVKLPGNLFLSARPRVSITRNTEFLMTIVFMCFTHGAPRDPPTRDHRPVDGDQYSRHGRGFRTMKERLRHSGTTLQHTTKRDLGASGVCESRLLKNTKKRSSPSLC